MVEGRQMFCVRCCTCPTNAYGCQCLCRCPPQKWEPPPKPAPPRRTRPELPRTPLKDLKKPVKYRRNP